MKIYCEETSLYKYVFDFEYDIQKINFCRKLRDDYGVFAIGYSDRAWRFNDIKIINDITKEYPDVGVHANMQDAMEKHETKTSGVKKKVKQKKATIQIKNIKGDLYPYQSLGVEFFLLNKGRAILADECGLGKTLQALAYVAHNNIDKTLVICPASVKFSWEAEVKKWTKLKSVVIDSKTILDSKMFNENNIFIINFDILKKFFEQLSSFRFDTMVVDECHFVKNLKSIRSKATRMLSKNMNSILLLSGTPLLSRPVELFSSLNMIDPKNWGSWYDYTKRYCAGHRNRFGYDSSGSSNINELKKKISKYFIRRLKKDVIDDLPDKIYTNVPLELDSKFRKEYDKIEKGVSKYINKNKNNSDVDRREFNSSKLVMLSSLRQLTADGKIKNTKEIADSIVEAGEKVLIFSSFISPLEELKEYYGDKAVIMTGKTKIDERKDIVNSFQNDDKIKVFLGGIKSSGVGITLTAASHVIFIDYSWVPADHIQAQDRAHRIGSEHSKINIIQLFCKETIDDYMKEMLEKKQELFNQLINPSDDADKDEGKNQLNVMSGVVKIIEGKHVDK